MNIYTIDTYTNISILVYLCMFRLNIFNKGPRVEHSNGLQFFTFLCTCPLCNRISDILGPKFRKHLGTCIDSGTFDTVVRRRCLS